MILHRQVLVATCKPIMTYCRQALIAAHKPIMTHGSQVFFATKNPSMTHCTQALFASHKPVVTHGRRVLVTIYKPTKHLTSSIYLILTEQARQSAFQLSNLLECSMPHVAVHMEIWHGVHKTNCVTVLLGTRADLQVDCRRGRSALGGQKSCKILNPA